MHSSVLINPAKFLYDLILENKSKIVLGYVKKDALEGLDKHQKKFNNSYANIE